MTVSYTCLKCEREFNISVSPIIPAKVSGPPEDCYPEEGGEIEPEECPICNAPVKTDVAYELAADKYNSELEDYAEYKYQERLDSQG